MKKIIHLSDLHIGHRGLSDRFGCIIQNLIFAKEPASDYIVVITGDLVETATRPGNLKEARFHVETLEVAEFRVLVVPGNHDYGTGTLGDKKHARSFNQVFFGSPIVEYPKLDIIDGMAFIGLDTMAEELDWHDRLFAEGELGEAQRQRLAAMLDSAPVEACDHRVVYMHHHPFDPVPFHQLRDSGELGQILMRHGRIDVLLYGHNHAGKKRNGKWGIPRCYDGGTSTRKNGAPGEHRVIDLSRDPRLDYDGDFHCSYEGRGCLGLWQLGW